MLKLKFYGQSCFVLRGETVTLAFDPYLSENPAKIPLDADVKLDYILVSHAHADHLGDTVALSEHFGATVVTTAEMGRHVTSLGCKKVEPMHIGGAIRLPQMRVKATLALHGSGVAGGFACGFLVTVEGVTLYFAGDTGLFGDMRLLGQYNAIDYALLPIGDRFTMGPEDAAIAAEMLNPRFVIPMHYNGNARTMQDPQRFVRLAAERSAAKVIVLAPGEETELLPRE